MKTMQKIMFVAASFAVVVFVSLSTVSTVHAQDYSGGCDFCGSYDYSFTPDVFDYSFTPDISYDYTYTPDLAYDYTYTPDLSYDYTYTPDSFYDYTYTPDSVYDYTYTPDSIYDYTFTPDTTYDYTFTPDYGYSYSSYAPGYSYAPTLSGGSLVGSTQYIPGQSIGWTSPTYHAPSYRAPSTSVTYPSTHISTVNNNTNNNTNINNITNTNNSSSIAIATVAPVMTAPVQYPVQYVQPIVQPTYYQQPSCSISISNYSGNAYGSYGYNQLATLTWSSQNAVSAYISPNVGSVSGWGSMQVYPTNSQIYTMTVYGQGGSATCTTQPFYVANYVAPVNPTPYVSLSQIPYTGLDFGTLGNAIYWLSLMVFAGAAAYLVLYYQGGAFALFGTRTNRVQVEMPKIAISSTPVQKPSVVSPIQLFSNKENTPSDTMHVAHSKDGSVPRIYISRA